MTDHRDLYRRLRNYLAGQHLGSTRDESLLQELLIALLCKNQLDSEGGIIRARASGADYRAVLRRVRAKLPNLTRAMDLLKFNDETLQYIDSVLSPVDMRSGDHDPFGDLYEIFTGSLARGQEGQFFTPRNAAQLLVEMVDPRPGERVLDPACGAGGFLAATAQRLAQAGADPSRTARCLFGIDKDAFLANMSALRLALLTGEDAPVECGDSLAWNFETRSPVGLGRSSAVDVILTNPPFGSKIVAASKGVQEEFQLGFRWRRDASTGRFVRTDELASSMSPQVAFVERCLNLLRDGGRMGVVLPESMLSSQRYRHVVQYIRDRATIIAIVGMPESLFKTSGSGGTHTKTCLMVLEKDSGTSASQAAIFMAETRWCGNDSRGKRGGPDELPEVARRFALDSNCRPADHLSYSVRASSVRNDVLAPRYYDPEPLQQLERLASSHDLVSVGDLLEQGVIEMSSGDEIGKLSYGTGDIPFVRTSDLSNWEIKLDPKHGVSEEIFASYSDRQDVREGDILMVRDGTYLIGTCAIVTKYDQRILYQSHILKLRVVKPEVVSPFLLLAALSCAPVKRQILAKRFTQDIIDSIGNRVVELVLPLPRETSKRDDVARKVENAVRERMEARELARQACLDIVDGYSLSEHEQLDISSIV